MQRTQLKRVEQIIFDGHANAPLFAYEFPGPAGIASNTNAIVQQLITAHATLDGATYNVRKDASLTPTQRAQKVQPVRDAVKAAQDSALEKLRAFETRVEAAEDKLFDPPPLASDDSAGAHLDCEIRERLMNVPQGDHDAIIDAISNPDSDNDDIDGERILVALLRDPFPTPDSIWARQVWQQRIETDRPGDVASVEADKAAIEWAQSAITGLGITLKQSESFGISALTPESSRPQTGMVV